MSSAVAVSFTCAFGSTRVLSLSRYTWPTEFVGRLSATRKMWFVTARSLPPEGLSTSVDTVLSGLVATIAVEPPPSRLSAVTQPSSTMRWATCVSVAPME